MGCYFANSPDAFAEYGEKFGCLTKAGVESRFRQKTACPDMSTFSKINHKKSIHLVIWFGGLCLVRPNIWFFWAFRRKNELRQSPTVASVMSLYFQWVLFVAMQVVAEVFQASLNLGCQKSYWYLRASPVSISNTVWTRLWHLERR